MTILARSWQDFVNSWQDFGKKLIVIFLNKFQDFGKKVVRP